MISESDFLDIDPLDIELAEYKDIIRLRRAQELSQDPTLTPRTIQKILTQEGLGVGHETYKDWEKEGHLRDILAEAKNLAKKLYEIDCLSIPEIGDQLRKQGYNYHNQIIGVWAKNWVCHPRILSPPQKPVISPAAFLQLISRISNQVVHEHNWKETIHQEFSPPLSFARNFYEILVNFFGEEELNTLSSQFEWQKSLIQLMEKTTGLPLHHPEFLNASKQPLIPQTSYTPLYILTNFAIHVLGINDMTQGKLFDIISSGFIPEPKPEPMLIPELEPEPELQEPELTSDIKAIVDSIMSHLKARYLSFDEYIRLQPTYPLRHTLDIMIYVWCRIPTLTSRFVKYDTWLVDAWVPYESMARILRLTSTKEVVDDIMGILDGEATANREKLQELTEELTTSIERRNIVSITVQHLNFLIYMYAQDHNLSTFTINHVIHNIADGYLLGASNIRQIIKDVLAVGINKGLFVKSNAPDEYHVVKSKEMFNRLALSLSTLLPEPGRNHRCFCGSGAKYKKCCLKILDRRGWKQRCQQITTTNKANAALGLLRPRIDEYIIKQAEKDKPSPTQNSR